MPHYDGNRVPDTSNKHRFAPANVGNPAKAQRRILTAEEAREKREGLKRDLELLRQRN